MHVRMQGNMQYVFHDVCHIQIITYFYGWCTVLETLGPWCLPDKKLVGSRPRVVRTPETEDAVLQSFDDDGRRSIFGKGKFNKLFFLFCKFLISFVAFYIV
jgi:hypothetical protein